MRKESVLNYRDCPNSFKDQLVNAGIQAGLAFFTTLAGIAVVQIKADPNSALLAGVIAGGLTFFTSLSIQRGLTEKEK